MIQLYVYLIIYDVPGIDHTFCFCTIYNMERERERERGGETERERKAEPRLDI